MKPTRPESRYKGVTYYTPKPDAPWRPWIRKYPKQIWLGHFADQVHAALAADFARWLSLGKPNKDGWYCPGRHRYGNPPNLAPYLNLPFDREKIIAIVLRHGLVDPVTLADNLSAYDEMAAEVARKLEAAI